MDDEERVKAGRSFLVDTQGNNGIVVGYELAFGVVIQEYGQKDLNRVSAQLGKSINQVLVYRKDDFFHLGLRTKAPHLGLQAALVA